MELLLVKELLWVPGLMSMWELLWVPLLVSAQELLRLHELL